MHYHHQVGNQLEVEWQREDERPCEGEDLSDVQRKLFDKLMLQTEYFKDDFYKLVLCECRRELELKEYDKAHDEKHHNKYKLQDSHRAVVPPVVKRESGFKKREQGTSSWEKK